MKAYRNAILFGLVLVLALGGAYVIASDESDAAAAIPPQPVTDVIDKLVNDTFPLEVPEEYLQDAKSITEDVTVDQTPWEGKTVIEDGVTVTFSKDSPVLTLAENAELILMGDVIFRSADDAPFSVVMLPGSSFKIGGLEMQPAVAASSRVVISIGAEVWFGYTFEDTNTTFQPIEGQPNTSFMGDAGFDLVKGYSENSSLCISEFSTDAGEDVLMSEQRFSMDSDPSLREFYVHMDIDLDDLYKSAAEPPQNLTLQWLLRGLADEKVTAKVKFEMHIAGLEDVYYGVPATVTDSMYAKNISLQLSNLIDSSKLYAKAWADEANIVSNPEGKQNVPGAYSIYIRSPDAAMELGSICGLHLYWSEFSLAVPMNTPSNDLEINTGSADVLAYGELLPFMESMEKVSALELADYKAALAALTAADEQSKPAIDAADLLMGLRISADMQYFGFSTENVDANDFADTMFSLAFTDIGLSVNMSDKVWEDVNPGDMTLSVIGMTLKRSDLSVSDGPNGSSWNDTEVGMASADISGSVGIENIAPIVALFIAPGPGPSIQNIMPMMLSGVDISLDVDVIGFEYSSDKVAGTLRASDAAGPLDPAKDVKPCGEWYLIESSHSNDILIPMFSLHLDADTAVAETAEGAEPDTTFVGIGINADGFSVINSGMEGPVLGTEDVNGKADVITYTEVSGLDVAVSSIDAVVGIDVMGIIGALTASGPVADPTFGLVLDMSIEGVSSDTMSDSFRIVPDFDEPEIDRHIKLRSEDQSVGIDGIYAVLDRTADLPLAFTLRGLTYTEMTDRTEYGLIESPGVGVDHRYSVDMSKTSTRFALPTVMMGLDMDLTAVPEGIEPGTEGYEEMAEAATTANVQVFFGFIMSLMPGSTDDPGVLIADLQYRSESDLTISGMEFESVEHSLFKDFTYTYAESQDYRSFIFRDPDTFGGYDRSNSYGNLGTLAVLSGGDEKSIGMSMSLDRLSIQEKRISYRNVYDDVFAGDIEIANLFMNANISSDALPVINAMIVSMIKANMPVMNAAAPVDPPTEPVEPPAEPAVPSLSELVMMGTDADIELGFDQLSVDVFHKNVYNVNMPFNPDMPGVQYYTGDELLINRTVVDLSMPDADADAGAVLRAALNTSSTPAEGEVPAKETVGMSLALDTVPGTEFTYVSYDANCRHVWLPGVSDDGFTVYNQRYPYLDKVVRDERMFLSNPVLDASITAEADDLSTLEKFIAVAQADLNIGAASYSERVCVPMDPNGPNGETDAGGNFVPDADPSDDYLSHYIEVRAANISCVYNGAMKDGFKIDKGVLMTPADLLKAEYAELEYGTCGFNGRSAAVDDTVLGLGFGGVSLGAKYDIDARIPSIVMNAESLNGVFDDGTRYVDYCLDNGRAECIGNIVVFGVRNGDLIVVFGAVDVTTGAIEEIPVTIPASLFGQMSLSGMLPAGAFEMMKANVDAAEINGHEVPVGTVIGVGDDSRFSACTVGGQAVTDAAVELKKGDVCTAGEGILITLHGFEGDELAQYRAAGTDLAQMPLPDFPDGYIFEGWFMDASFEIPAAGNLTVPVDLYAKFSVDSYDVHFDTLGGQGAADAKTAAFGTAVTLPSDITKEGYTLTGWMYGTQKLGFQIDRMPAEDVYLTAVWVKDISADDIKRAEGTAKMDSSENSMQLSDSISDELLSDDAVDRLEMNINGTSISMSKDSYGKLYDDKNRYSLIFTSGITDTLDKVLSDKVDKDRLGHYGEPKMFIGLHVDGCKPGSTSDMGIVTVTVPYEGGDAKVLYIEDETGAVIPMEDCFYDPVAKTLTFRTYHFSTFAVAPVDSWNIGIDSTISGGQVAVQDKASVGDSVTVEVSPDAGKKLVRLVYIEGGIENDITSTHRFVMPDNDVTVSAVFADVTYTISVTAPVGGSVTVPVSVSTAGAEIPVTAVPDEGRGLKSLTYSVGAGKPVPITDGRFVMPAGNVVISAVFSQEYTLTIDPDISGGRLIIPAKAVEGTEVSVMVEPDTGMKLVSLTYTLDGGDSVLIEDGRFIMPAGDVKVSAVFDNILYTVGTASGITGGSVSVSCDSAKIGTEVIVTATPADGKQLKKLTYTADGREPVEIVDGKFLMPAGNVVINAEFEDVPAPSDGGNTMLIVIGVIAVLAVLGAGLYFVKKH